MEMDTGRLMRLERDLKTPEGVERVPSIFEKLALRKIEAAEAMGTEARVNLRSQHPLAQWGREKRKDRAKEKRKAKIAAASRRRNRHGKR
jgi:hypothetical protein